MGACSNDPFWPDRHLPSVQEQTHEAALDKRASARAILAQKYGEQFERIAGPESSERTYIVVEPVPVWSDFNNQLQATFMI